MAPDLPVALRLINTLAEGQRSADGALIDAVQNARELRFTWDQIAEALGTSRQAATSRFLKHMPPHLRKLERTDR